MPSLWHVAYVASAANIWLVQLEKCLVLLADSSDKHAYICVCERHIRIHMCITVPFLVDSEVLILHVTGRGRRGRQIICLLNQHQLRIDVCKIGCVGIINRKLI